jgi:hypothetical protein
MGLVHCVQCVHPCSVFGDGGNPYQRHILRDRWPRTAASPAGVQRNWKSVLRGKNICTGLTRATKADQKSLVPARQAQRTNHGGTPFICTLWVPIHLSRQGPPLSSLSGPNPPAPPGPFPSVPLGIEDSPPRDKCRAVTKVHHTP